MANQIINVVVNSKGAVTVVKELNKMGDSARQTTTYLNGLRSVLAAALTFSGVGAIVEVVDNFTVLQNRLRQVVEESDQVGESWNRLIAIANDSYSTIDSTVSLYFRVAQAYKAWGESAEEAYEFTDLFQKAATLSGSSVQTTAQAVYQFSQALNKGKLDGDEFRSVLEGLPYVATLIQDSLGVTRAELYELSADGKISLDRLKQAFEDAAETIRSDWGNITPTIGMALIVLKNNWTDFVGEIQTSTGLFTVIAHAIILVANNFDILALAISPVVAALVFMGGRLALGLVVIALRDLSSALRLATAAQWLFNAAVSANPYVLAALAIAALVAGVIYFRNELGLTNENLAILWQAAVSAFNAMLSGINSVLMGVVSVVRKLNEWTGIWTLISRSAQLLLAVIVNVFNGIVDAIRTAAAYVSEALVPVFDHLIAVAQNYFTLLGEIASFISDVFVAAIVALKPAWDTVYAALEPGLTWVQNILRDITEGWKILGSWLQGAFAKVIKDVFDGWIIILQSVLNFVNKIIDALRAALALLKAVTGTGGGKGAAAAGAHYGASFKAGEGFATGGQFKVGGTGAGRDTTPVAFRAERGERVTVETKKQQRQADNASGEVTVNAPTSIVNVLDPAMALAAMETAAGQRVIVNVMKANRDEINYILGAA